MEGTHKEKRWIIDHFTLIIIIISLIVGGFKCYDYYTDAQLKQSELQQTEQYQHEQDSIKQFVAVGEKSCRVCEDFKKNRPSSGGEIIVIICLVVLCIAVFLGWFWVIMKDN